jgi:hypothetical protein
MTCNKCKQEATATIACGICGKEYARCAKHGGESGCRRSLHSHAALYHTGQKGVGL